MIFFYLDGHGFSTRQIGTMVLIIAITLVFLECLFLPRVSFWIFQI